MKDSEVARSPRRKATPTSTAPTYIHRWGVIGVPVGRSTNPPKVFSTRAWEAE